EVDVAWKDIADRCGEWLSLTQFGVFRSESFVTADRSEPLFEDSARALAWTSTSNPSPNSAATLQGPQGAFRPLVMLVDDDERILRLLSHLLERDGFRVAVARSGEEAMRLNCELSPHILITDWMMPGLSGIELCREVKRREKSKDTYVIILTAREEEERVVESFDAGADDYVSKPFKPLVLLSRVRAGYRVLQLQKQVDRASEVSSQQVGELGALTRKLRSMTLTDMLTELPNRRFAMQKLDEAWRLSVRHERELSLVLLDIDHFKRINDEHGHDVGDEVLAEVGNVLKNNVREGDIVCRFGGEEFIVITTSTSENVAMQCAERLRVAMAEHSFECLPKPLTLSLGVAQRSVEMESVDELIKAADEAVFEAKETGRNRSVVRSSMPRRKSA
ncbi:MAG: diguanylate cyclase, partial [Planctomycetota bacterium]